MTSGRNKVGPLRIEALANGGAGIARHEGRVIFVPGTVPGDRVSCRLVKEKARYAEAELLSIEEAAPERCPPPCPVADQCGGCQWQQMPYEVQLQWKERLFHETLVRRCQVGAELLEPIVPSPESWGYRSRAQVKCYQGKDGFVCGFFRPKSHFVVAVESCPVLAPPLNRLMEALRSRLAPSSFAPRIPQFDLALGDDGACRVVVHYLGREIDPLIAFLQPLAEDLDFALLIQQGRKENLALVRGAGDLSIRVDHPPLDLHYAAGGFAQINTAQNRFLIDAVLGAAELTNREHVLDLFCGMGNFSLPLARRAARLLGVENYAPSIAQARRNAARFGFTNTEFRVGDAEEVLQRQAGAQGFDLLVMDPPRSGAYSLVKQLVKTPVARLLYISCDPQTLARDLQPLLHDGYRLVSSQPFDMFPHTHHVESLTALEHCR